jgi:hypothetical protein
MWRWGLVLLVWLAVPAAAEAAPVAIGNGPLLALAVHDGVGYAVIERDSASKPLALVRSSGRGAGRAMPFGAPGAEYVDVAAGPGGVEVAWSRPVSSAFEYFVAPAGDPADVSVKGLGTGPPQLDGGLLAHPDPAGDVAVGDERLTTDAPEHRHLPLDAADGLILDLDQQRTSTQLRLLGPDAPARPILSVGRLADVEATLAVAQGRAYVAYAIDGRAFLASASGDGWSTRRIASGISGRPAVARAGGQTHVAYARNGAVYLGGTRLGPGGSPLLAADGTRLLAGWTHHGTAMLTRAG